MHAFCKIKDLKYQNNLRACTKYFSQQQIMHKNELPEKRQAGLCHVLFITERWERMFISGYWHTNTLKSKQKQTKKPVCYFWLPLGSKLNYCMVVLYQLAHTRNGNENWQCQLYSNLGSYPLLCHLNSELASTILYLPSNRQKSTPSVNQSWN